MATPDRSLQTRPAVPAVPASASRAGALAILLATLGPGTLLAAPERCLPIGDNTVSLIGLVEKVVVPSRSIPTHFGWRSTFVPARTSYYFRVKEPFRIQEPTQPACRPEGGSVTSLRLMERWQLPIGQTVQVTGVLLTDETFMPGRVCSTDAKPDCVDLDDDGEVIGSWNPRP